MSALAHEEVETSVTDALTKAIGSLDSSRRVGWAKAFEAIRRVEGLEEDVRQTRDELVVLRRAYSRLCGLAQTAILDRTSGLQEELAAHFAAERSFRHDDAFAAGVAVGMRHVDDIKGRGEADLVDRRRRKAERRAFLTELHDRARELGHDMRNTAARGVFVARCSCGETHLFERESDLHRWKNDHVARIARDCDWSEAWSTERKSRRDAEQEEG